MPVPVIQARCGISYYGRCTCMYLPLRACIVLSIYKSQGLSIGGPHNVIKRVVVHLRKLNSRAAPESALVGTSRAINSDILAFGNDNVGLTIEDVTKIGTTPVYANRRAWLDRPREKIPANTRTNTSKIAALAQEGTCDAGCNFLIH